MTHISNLWGSGSRRGREDAILAYLSAGPLTAGRILLSMDARGHDGPQRFLLDVEGYVSDPTAWRIQASKRDTKRMNELEAEDRAAREGI